MKELDLKRFESILAKTDAEEMVSTKDVNPHLMEKVIRPILNGTHPCFGDMDYALFSDIDLRCAAYYCEELGRLAGKLERLVQTVAQEEPAALRARGYC